MAQPRHLLGRAELGILLVRTTVKKINAYLPRLQAVGLGIIGVIEADWGISELPREVAAASACS